MPKWNLKGLTKTRDVYEVQMNQGEKLTAKF